MTGVKHERMSIPVGIPPQDNRAGAPGAYGTFFQALGGQSGQQGDAKIVLRQLPGLMGVMAIQRIQERSPGWRDLQEYNDIQPR